MKKAEREVYRILTKEVGACLCTFCKYSRFSGMCDDAEIECQHPLVDKTIYTPFEETTWPGEDCWGFRPNHPVSEIADVVGIILAEGFVQWYYDYSNSKGILTVYGRKSKLAQEDLGHDQANLPV